MKMVWFCAAICTMMLPVGGCGRSHHKSVPPIVAMTEDGSPFPAWLAGRWKADRHGWELVFEPDGRIVSAVLSLGRVAVRPGQTTTRQTKESEQAVFTPGPWVVHYDPATSLLTVKIDMEHIRVPMGDNVLEGSSTDTFCGPLSPTMNAWQVQWTTFPHYTARTSEGKSVALATDEACGQAQPLVFVKTPDPSR
ncbi:MAG TPA: hypothetical protein PKH24_16350 [Sedimentisphaerales bacterium]|jgi:hypothetical protein|nr:hypothetical protein [Sedimentisphaerales bacterium]HNU30567.1 hypothetical protein [Sedimentisphaerales bacterium]